MLAPPGRKHPPPPARGLLGSLPPCKWAVRGISCHRRKRMSGPIQEKQQLEKLEHVAEGASEPEEIEQQARQTPPTPRAKAPAFWFVPHLVAAAVLGAGILLLEWWPG